MEPIKKVCTKCKEEKELGSYYKEERGLHGLRADCKQCCRDRKRLKYTSQLEYNHSRSKQYNLLNKAKISKRKKQYRLDNLETCTERERAYKKAHPEKNTFFLAQRRAAILNATPDNANLDSIKAIYASCARVSKCLGIPHHVDHIIPLSKGGLHHEDNLQVIPAAENLSKGAKMPQEFYK